MLDEITQEPFEVRKGSFLCEKRFYRERHAAIWTLIQCRKGVFEVEHEQLFN